MIYDGARYETAAQIVKAFQSVESREDAELFLRGLMMYELGRDVLKGLEIVARLYGPSAI
jgi:hypothetical protein